LFQFLISGFVDVYMMAGFLCISCLHFDDVIFLCEPNKRPDFEAQNFIEFLAMLRVFKDLDGL